MVVILNIDSWPHSYVIVGSLQWPGRTHGTTGRAVRSVALMVGGGGASVRVAGHAGGGGGGRGEVVAGRQR